MPDAASLPGPDPPGRQAQTDVNCGSALVIEKAITRLLCANAGQGPGSIRVHLSREMVVVLMSDCLTTGEKTLREIGHPDLVRATRDTVHEAIRVDACAAVTEATGRRVIAYMCDQHHHPDIAVLVFALDPGEVT